MGCQTSNDRGSATMSDIIDPKTETLAKKQRRRLSVAPHHVGDISVFEAKEENDGLTDIELKAKAHMKVVANTRKGVVPYNKNKVNQDRAVVKYALQDDPAICLFGVMDGHGEYGHYVAQFVQERLPFWLSQEKNLKIDVQASITNAVANLVDQLHRTNINIAFSGTTAVFAVKINERLYSCNIGDSRCVLARLRDGQLQAIPLTSDQKPENPGERQRIIAAGGRVEPLPGPPGEDCGPHRVWLAEVDVPGLAMSRSIGDEVSQTVGVISVPEIKVFDITDDDVFAIWASDGVWEFVTNELAVEIVWKNKHSLREAASQLVQMSRKLWLQEEDVIDDITCVITQFNEWPRARTTVTDDIVEEEEDAIQHTATVPDEVVA